MGPSRRNALRILGAAALAPLAACAPSAPVVPDTDHVARASPPPVTRGRAAAIRVDAHCHVFNARDIPGAGFLRGPVANDFAHNGFSRWLIEHAADLIAALAKAIAPTARAELDSLQRDPPGGSDDYESRAGTQRERFVRAFLPGALAGGFAAAFRQQMSDYNAQRRMLLGDNALPNAWSSETLDAQSIATILALADARDVAEANARDRERLDLRIEAGKRGYARSLGNAWDLVTFMYRATSPRHLNLWRLMQFNDGSNGPRIDLFLPSMIDFDYWLQPSSRARNIETQSANILLMEHLAALNRDRVLPLVAYNPQADVDQQGRALARVQLAVEKHGFAGVKLYPPMGFLPFGNASARIADSCQPHFDPAALDKVLAQLYAWAGKARVPILAHTSHSIGPTSADEECAGPPGWAKAFDGFGDLRVQAGHLAGEKMDWSSAFVRMMDRPEARWLHADVANLDDLFGSDPVWAAEFATLIQSKLADGTQVFDRLLYGSDFYMTDMSGSSRMFAQQMQKFLGAHLSADAVDRVFGGNAVRLYGLAMAAPGEPGNRSRLEAYYRARGVADPPWTSRVDPAS